MFASKKWFENPFKTLVHKNLLAIQTIPWKNHKNWRMGWKLFHKNLFACKSSASFVNNI